MVNLALLVLLGALSSNAPGHACKITFQDDFDLLDVSARGPGTRWTAHTPWNGDFGDATFSDPSPTGPFEVKDGVLSITAAKGPDGHWRSGLLSSVDPQGHGFAQQYGYFEMRAQLPPGPGVWPGFWLVATGERKNFVELDIVEYYGVSPNRFSSTLHIWKDGSGKDSREDQRWTQAAPGSLGGGGFHTWGADVGAKEIDIYFDGRKVQTFPTPPELNRPMGVLIDMGLGGGWPIDKTPNPSVMRVDYVKVCAP